MSKPVIVLTVGISCSGKRSWAEEYCRNRDDWCNINRDDLRFEMFCSGKRVWDQYKFNRSNEKKVTEAAEQLAFNSSVFKQNIIISDTNLKSSVRNKWKIWAEDNDYEYMIKEFPISWEEAVKRNNQREGGISRSILRSQYYKMQEYLGEYKYQPDPSLPDCVLVDIDGTVAEKGDRGFFDWDKVGTDKPKDFVIAMLDGLIMAGIEPIFLSGRDGSCKSETYDWIEKNIMEAHYDVDIYGFNLFMRTAGDMRKDYIVKRELFDKYVKGKYNVVGVLDDRPSVINNCWLDMGLPNVISVADQNLEF